MADRLSPREIQVLKAIADGLVGSEIAQSLFISIATVRTHKRAIYDKLHANCGANAVHIGWQLGILGQEAVDGD